MLLYEHGNRSGAKGVILSQPLGPTDPRFEPAAAPGGLPALSHFLGGPVGMPGDALVCLPHNAHSRWSHVVPKNACPGNILLLSLDRDSLAQQPATVALSHNCTGVRRRAELLGDGQTYHH